MFLAWSKEIKKIEGGKLMTLGDPFPLPRKQRVPLFFYFFNPSLLIKNLKISYITVFKGFTCFLLKTQLMWRMVLNLSWNRLALSLTEKNWRGLMRFREELKDC